jgi:hypothetical protein
MTHYYRLYSVGADGHFVGAVDVEAADDVDASIKAQGLLNGLDLELWQRDRFVAKFLSQRNDD